LLVGRSAAYAAPASLGYACKLFKKSLTKINIKKSLRVAQRFFLVLMLKFFASFFKKEVGFGVKPQGLDFMTKTIQVR